MTKYRARKTVVDGITFDSKAEARRYNELILLWRLGEITNLRVHSVFGIHVSGEKVCNYISDFDYRDQRGNYIVEDVKGVRTPVYRLKKKLMLIVNGIEITEVSA